MGDVTLYIPGLFELHHYYDDLDLTGLDSLETILTYGKQAELSDTSYCQQLCGFFDLKLQAGIDCPIAAITRLIDDASRPTGIWMRADPVHLSADRDGLTLYDCSRFSLSQHDALALGAKLKGLFSEHGYELEIPVPTRWYLKLEKHPRIHNRELHEVRGRNVQNFMPTGEDEAHWTRLFNEVQMVLHDSDINQHRAKTGQLPINSVWFWGLGSLPDVLSRDWSTVFSHDVLAEGLCMLSGTEHKTLAEISAADITSGNFLMVLDDLSAASGFRDVEQWREGVNRIEKDWLAALLAGLRNGDIGQLSVIANGQKITLTRRALLCFWKRRQSLQAFMPGNH